MNTILINFLTPLSAVGGRSNSIISFWGGYKYPLLWTIVVFLIAGFAGRGYTQDIQLSVTNYEGTQTKKVEYQYIQGRKAKVGNIEYRDDKTKLLKGVDLNTYSVQEMVPNGYWKEYYQNGKLKAHYIYVDGSREGEAKTYYENGSLERKFTFRNGIIDGEFSEYYDNGSLQSTCKYVNSVRVGNVTVYDPNKNPILYLKYSEPEIRKGHSVLIAGEQAKIVRIQAQRKYNNGEVAEDGYFETYYSAKGFPFYYDDNFRREGAWKEYDENGVKVSETTYANNYPNGLYISFYPSGKKKEEMTYVPEEFWGQTISIINGPYRNYFENGQMAKSGTMKTLVTKSNQEEGQLETEPFNAGDWKLYDQNGRFIEFISLGNGTEVLCEMNESQLKEQQNISKGTEFPRYKQQVIDKFSKYQRFHFGEIIDKLDAVNTPEKQFFEELRVGAMAVFKEYSNSLKGCDNRECVSDYATKLENIFIKLEELSTKDSLIGISNTVRQYGIKQALKI